MTSQAFDHAAFDELAAGYALGTLDHGDEIEFRDHLIGCVKCQEAITAYTEIAGALALSVPAEQTGWPSPQLRARILAATEPGSPAKARPVELVSPASPRRRRALAIAAAVVLIAGAVTGVWLSRAQSPVPVASCTGLSDCHQVVLTVRASRSADAKVVVVGRTAWLVPVGLRPDDTARQIYVLWQVGSGRKPVPVGAFDVRSGGPGAIRIGSLGEPYRETTAFAVSLEQGRTVPAVPSRAVAAGLVPAS